jgi:F0F1-type ATP synthase assembly protein I
MGVETVTDSADRATSSGRGYAYGGPAFVGGILVGIGLGILLGDFGAWFLIGIGAGFILMAFIAAIGK